jgi:hypothetical protein
LPDLPPIDGAADYQIPEKFGKRDELSFLGATRDHAAPSVFALAPLLPSNSSFSVSDAAVSEATALVLIIVLLIINGLRASFRRR